MTCVRLPPGHTHADGQPDLDGVAACRAALEFIPKIAETVFLGCGPFLALDAAATGRVEGRGFSCGRLG